MHGIILGTNNMKNQNIKNSVYVLVTLSALSWIAIAKINEIDLSVAASFFSLIPKVVTIDVIFIFLFTKWGWKIPIFRNWLVPFPNLSGTWTGLIYSSWNNPDTDDRPDPIPVMLTIKQSFFHISCRMTTSEMESQSYIEGFQISEERQVKKLAYTYTSKPRILLNNRSVPHDGSIIFSILESPERKLHGSYWTERKTVGEIKLEFKSKRCFDELPSDLNYHPVLDSENNE